MNCYHFHVFDGRDYAWDSNGVLLPDLAAVVSEAELRARGVMRASTDSYGWRTWMVDVRGNDDITLFHYPFPDIPNVSQDVLTIAHEAACAVIDPKL